MLRLVFIALISTSFNISAQFTFGIKISGLAYHPQKEINENHYRWNLDKNGHLVSFIGISFIANYSFNQYLGVKTTHTIMPFDCAGKWAFVSHIGINLHDRIIGWKNNVHRFSGSFGPLWYYRKGWIAIDGYKQEPNFIKSSKNNKWEHKFVWYGAQVQYDFYFRTNQAVSVNIFPGYPYIYSFAIGETFVIK
jgi:ABC-type long-subunit fatty acid transport system fused permease/ATPase subunit